MYLRFGAIPENGKSINFTVWSDSDHAYCDALIEHGMTMREAAAKLDPTCKWAYEQGVSVFVYGAMNDNTRITVKQRYLAREVCYEVIGTPCGIGADGEPLLADVAIVRELSRDEALACITVGNSRQRR